MGLWEVTEEVLGQAERSQEAVPCYSHISHRALKDIPKEYTNPYNCKVRALAFNNNHKVTLVCYLWLCYYYYTTYSADVNFVVPHIFFLAFSDF